VTSRSTPLLSYHSIKLMFTIISLRVASNPETWTNCSLSSVPYGTWCVQYFLNLFSQLSFNPGFQILFEILALKGSSDKVCLLRADYTPPLTQCMIFLITLYMHQTTFSTCFQIFYSLIHIIKCGFFLTSC